MSVSEGKSGYLLIDRIHTQGQEIYVVNIAVSSTHYIW